VIEFRLRTHVPRAEIAAQAGFIPTDDYYDALVRGPARVIQPDGRPLLVYLPGVLRDELAEAFPVLSSIRNQTPRRSRTATPRRSHRRAGRRRSG
jgi:hypothetical protein